MPSTVLYLHTLSPLHCGTGQGSGIIDLPIAREATTAWPEVPGSTIKGVLRDACREAKVSDDVLEIVFGPDTSTQQGNPSDNAGGVWSTTAHLLWFPVRSFRGTFAWVTCPHALRRWARVYTSLGHNLGLTIPGIDDDERILLTEAGKQTLAIDDTVLLEDFALAADTSGSAEVDAIATTVADIAFPDDGDWRDFFVNRAGIVSDDLFGFLVRTATDVRARVRIDDDRKIVVDGALWYEETVPIETIFTMPLRATPQGEERLKDKATGYATQIEVVGKGIAYPVQIGGNASVGNGIVQVRMDDMLLPAATANGAGQTQEEAVP